MEGESRGEREEVLVMCKLCSAASHLRFQVKEYIQHIKLFHAHQMNFKITCDISGCKRTYTNPVSFYNHVYAVHGVEKSSESCDASVIDASLDCDEDNDGYSIHDDDEDDEDVLNDVDVFDSQLPCSSKESIQKSSAIFLLGLKEKFKLTQISLQGVIQGVTALTQQNIGMLKSQVCMNI